MDDEAFWLRHLRLGLVLFAVAIAVALVYILAGDPVRRTPLIALAAVALVFVAIGAFLPHERIVGSSGRSTFFYAWTAFSVSFVLFVAAVDGGAGSPLALLLVLTVIYSGLAYPPPAVVVVTLTTGVAYAALAALGPPAPTGDVVMLTGSVLALGILSAAVASARQRSHGALLAMHLQLRETARRDDLTGCLTRAAFHEAVGAELARASRHRRSTSIAMVDLDGFKEINDTEGHLSGDAMLGRVGAILRSAMRAGDEAGRVGGDEFAVMLAETGIFDAARTAERLLISLAAEGVAASVGVAESVPGDAVNDLLGRADAALYEAKRAGKAQVVMSGAGDQQRC